MSVLEPSEIFGFVLPIDCVIYPPFSHLSPLILTESTRFNLLLILELLAITYGTGIEVSDRTTATVASSLKVK